MDRGGKRDSTTTGGRAAVNRSHNRRTRLVQGNGHAVAAGLCGGDFAVARYVAALALDTTFDCGVGGAYGGMIGLDLKIAV